MKTSLPFPFEDYRREGTAPSESTTTVKEDEFEEQTKVSTLVSGSDHSGTAFHFFEFTWTLPIQLSMVSSSLKHKNNPIVMRNSIKRDKCDKG
jgi:hypothetical protein